MMNIWILNDKGKKHQCLLVEGYEPEPVSVSWMSLAWVYMFKELYKKATKEI